MNKRIDYTYNGGFPLTQYAADWMQSSYRNCLGAIAKMVGNKVILYGCDLVGANITDGWISYNGELIPFIGAPVGGGNVVITETNESRNFQDANNHVVYFNKQATMGLIGDFLFSDLKKIAALGNTWLPGDLNQKYVNNAYIAANFDGGGFGINKETGWQILSSAVPAAAGKVLVNLDAADADFNTAGNIGGEKKHALTAAENGPHTHTYNTKTGTAPQTGSATQCWVGDVTANTGSSGLGTPHNNLQPYFVVLTLIKL